MPRKVFLNEDQAAEFLGLKPATLKRRRVSRIDCPPYTKVGSGKAAPVRYDEAELVAWLNQWKVAGS